METASSKVQEAPLTAPSSISPRDENVTNTHEACRVERAGVHLLCVALLAHRC